jgi:ubiquinone/menaquinone biosynthesis C-methylase UbiE
LFFIGVFLEPILKFEGNLNNMENPMEYNLGVRINERNITSVLKHVRRGNVLDVGCGLGYLAGKLASRFDVIGLDMDKGSIGFADENTDALFVVGDASMLPFRDSSIECVVASEIIEHLPKDGGLIEEMGRVTKAGATIVITTPSTEGVMGVSSACHGSGPERHYRPGYTRDELERKLKGHFRTTFTKYSITLFTRIILEVTKRAYMKKQKGFGRQSDIFKVTDSWAFRFYKLVFPLFWIFIYVDEVLYRLLRGSDIMVVARKRRLPR